MAEENHDYNARYLGVTNIYKIPQPRHQNMETPIKKKPKKLEKIHCKDIKT